MKDFLDEILQDMKELDGSIPDDKDCKKCSHARNGVSRGMMSPCFDFCQGHGLGSIYLGEKFEKQDREDDKWLGEMWAEGLDGPEIARRFKKRCEERK